VWILSASVGSRGDSKQVIWGHFRLSPNFPPNFPKQTTNYPHLVLEFRFPILICHCDTGLRSGVYIGECMANTLNYATATY
jgi:hypothetical protein